MKIQVEIEVPDNLEGALKQVMAKFRYSEQQVVEQAVRHALITVCDGLFMEGSLEDSMSVRREDLRHLSQKLSQLIVNTQKAVADTVAIKYVFASLFTQDSNNKG